jgi:hypothetical protein
VLCVYCLACEDLAGPCADMQVFTKVSEDAHLAIVVADIRAAGDGVPAPHTSSIACVWQCSRPRHPLLPQSLPGCSTCGRVAGSQQAETGDSGSWLRSKCMQGAHHEMMPQPMSSVRTSCSRKRMPCSRRRESLHMAALRRALQHCQAISLAVIAD